MNRLVREYEFSPEQQARVEELARALDLTPTTAGILYARGMDDEDKMRTFLHPSRSNLLSPFLMSGMREAAELLKRAKAEEWRVVVYGDYDADGIGACAILYRALRRFGIEPCLYVPEREDGYGMSVAAIDRIFDECLPDLFVTVDCGISNAREVEYIKEQGAYVIVTDHHELPETLPDCICINPKLRDSYPYDNLCGAGVAFKLATALIGEEAYDLIDFCALSTVADSVPLLGENRDLVFEGLRRIEQFPRPAFTALIGKSAEMTAQTLAFSLAPRVNAAGRMGDARAALRLFTTDDEDEIAELAEKLNAYNLERQRLCDELYEKASREAAMQGAYGNIVMLVGEDWTPGLIGIAAARIAELYSRPTILFVRRGEILRGSARSIGDINIFEALKANAELMTEYGGHAQAAGVSVREENFEALKKALDEYIGTHYTREDFVPTVTVCEEITEEFPRKLAVELNALEPCGVGNRRPLFFARARKTNAALLKPASPHVALTGGGLDFMYFGGCDDLRILRSDVEKSIVFECNLSKFRGKESLKGFVRTVIYDGGSGTETDLDCFESLVRSLAFRNKEVTLMTAEETDAFIRARDGECAYGLCVVSEDRASLDAFPSLKDLPHEVFRLSSASVRNTALLAPVTGCDLSAFREIVYLERPEGIAQRTGKARLYAADRPVGGAFAGMDLSRGALAGVFSALRAAEGRETGESFAETARLLRSLGFDPKYFVLALAVFSELGLVDCTGGRLRIIRGKRTELGNSAIYSGALRLAGV